MAHSHLYSFMFTQAPPWLTCVPMASAPNLQLQPLIPSPWLTQPPWPHTFICLPPSPCGSPAPMPPPIAPPWLTSPYVACSLMAHPVLSWLTSPPWSPTAPWPHQRSPHGLTCTPWPTQNPPWPTQTPMAHL
ncbi:proline-rich protein 36-like [Homarus americanus]|uniref:proline-rich protein 36-like n=1 Tax=Homarus americanus TaxID=6706 RepID=UPI001C45C029|nr:proline-rich protein 36-like [Homarus americanus]